MQNIQKEKNPFLTNINYKKNIIEHKGNHFKTASSQARKAKLYCNAPSKEFLPPIANKNSINVDLCAFLYEKAIKNSLAKTQTKAARAYNIKKIENQLYSALGELGLQNIQNMINKKLLGEEENNLYSNINKNTNQMMFDMKTDEEYQLVELKNRYNKVHFEIKKIEKYHKGLSKKIESLSNKVRGKTHKEDTYCLKEISFQASQFLSEIEVYDNMVKNYKADLTIMKKKNGLLKRLCHEYNKMKLHGIKGAEDDEELAVRKTSIPIEPKASSEEHLLAEKKENLLLMNKIKDYIEIVETTKIIQVEDRILKEKELQNYQEKKKKIQKDLENLNESFKKAKNRIDNFKILKNEIQQSINILRVNVQASSDLEIIEKLKSMFLTKAYPSHKSAFKERKFRVQSNKKDQDGEIYSPSMDNSKNFVPYRMKSSKIVQEKENTIKKESTKVENLKKKNLKTNNEIFKACLVFSRIIYQLTPSTACQLSLSENNLIDIMSFVGMRLEQVLDLLSSTEENLLLANVQKSVTCLTSNPLRLKEAIFSLNLDAEI